MQLHCNTQVLFAIVLLLVLAQAAPLSSSTNVQQRDDQVILHAAFLTTSIEHVAPASDIKFMQPRDFSDDQRQFHQIVRLLHNMRSRIGVPFSAMMNVGLDYPITIEIDPLDLTLLVSGYCFICDTRSSPESTQPCPFQNTMVELDETQLVMLCAEVDEYGFEWPMVRICDDQHKNTLLWFLADLHGRGSKLAVSKERIMKAPVIDIDKYRCIPTPPNTTCTPMPIVPAEGHIATMTTMTLSWPSTGDNGARATPIVTSVSTSTGTDGPTTDPESIVCLFLDHSDIIQDLTVSI